jgi:multidrug efflux pump subunit AcrA (membrane-fusion protein)
LRAAKKSLKSSPSNSNQTRAETDRYRVGEVRPIRYIKLTSEVPGRIEEIYVTAGDQVTKGKPLVRIDPTQLQSSQEAQWAATQASINDVQNARNAVTSAQQSLVRRRGLQVAAARQQVVAFQTSVDRAQVDLNDRST